MYRYLGDQGGLAAALDRLARTLQAQGKHHSTRQSLEQSLRIATEMAYVSLQLVVLTSVAELLLASGAAAWGMALASLVARHPATDGQTSQRVQALLVGIAPPTEPPELSGEHTEHLDGAVASAQHALAALDLADAPEIQPGATATASHGLVEPLTEREIEILASIAAGHSNQEIAQRLILSVGTVKWYTTQIYGKLGVKSRTQAIARARQLGLLA